MRVLVADDNAVMSQVVQFNLERAGYDVDVVEDGQLALDLAQATAYDVIVTDYQMPKLDGREVCAAVRADGPNTGTPIIVCSAKGYEVDRHHLTEELGVAEILYKPFSPRNLVSLVSELSSQHLCEATA